jgi:hypothetical protein
LYNVMSLKFRQAFKNTLFSSCGRSHRSKPKPTVLRTYRFRNGHYAVDANLTLVHANGFASLLRAKKPGPEIQYIGTRSHSSSQSGGNPPLGHLMLPSNPKSDTESSHRQEDTKGCHSFHYHPRRPSGVSHDQRMYHSYA